MAAQGDAETADQPTRRKQVVQTLFILATYFILGALRSQEGLVFLDLISITNSQIGSGSIMFTVSALGYIVGVLLFGVLYDKVNNDILYCACVFLAGGFTLVIPWSTPLALMIAVFGLRSLFTGPIDSGSSVMCAKTWLSQAAPYLQGLQFLFAIGGIISPFITEPFLLERQTTNDTRTSPNSVKMSNSTSTMHEEGNLSFVKDTPFANFTLTNDNSQEPGVTTSRVYIAFAIAGGSLLCIGIAFALKIMIYSSGDFDRFNTGKESGNESERPDPMASRPLLLKVVFYALLAADSFSYGCLEKILMSFLVTFTVEHLDWSKTDGSLATTVFWSGFAAGRFLGIFLVKLLKPSTLLILNHIGLLITCATMTVAGHLSWDADEVWWVLIGCSGLFVAPVFATKVFWLDTDFTPLTGKLMSFIYIWLFAGTMTHMVLLGYLFELTPLWFVDLLAIHGALLLITMLGLWFMARQISGISARDSRE